MFRPILALLAALSLTSCATLQAQLTPEQCALRLQQSQTIEDAFKVLSQGGLAPEAVRVILQAIVDGRTTLTIACSIANDPHIVSEINSGRSPPSEPDPEPVTNIL